MRATRWPRCATAGSTWRWARSTCSCATPVSGHASSILIDLISSSRPMLQSCARVTIGPWRWNSYFTCGFCGYLAGLALSMWLCGQAGLAAPARLAIAIVPPVVLLILVRLSAAITGRERIVFYENALAATVGTALVAALAGAPALAALDIATLGVGAFLAC